MYYKEYIPELLSWWIYDKFDILLCECVKEENADWLLSILNKL